MGRLQILVLAVLVPLNGAFADSSSPLLAAYYDRQMAIVGGVAYGWADSDKPVALSKGAVQVGVGRRAYYVRTDAGDLLKFRSLSSGAEKLLGGVVHFAAGRTGVLAIHGTGELWWLPADGARRKLADNAVAAAVGDSANYFVTETGALFVKGAAHRGQYGDGRLTETERFVQTASDVAQITAHTGHAILMTRRGDVLGTGGNIYGPVGRYGLGDKAVRWSKLISGAKAIATGSSHSLAVMSSGDLFAWGAGYDPDPKKILNGVSAVAAGSSVTLVRRSDGSLWQWDRGEKPRRIAFPGTP